MVASMHHEPFYTSGVLDEKLVGCHVGWVSHKGSYSDCMAVWNEKRDIALIFTGEHYADSIENLNLRASGHSFPDGDASCLVHLYEEHGLDFLRSLNGCFSGVIIDKRTNKVLLFNDRYGLGRVYVHENNDGLYFSSEAKAILNALPQLRRLDMRALGELLSCGCTLQDRTLFPEISLLPTASVWTFSKGRPIRKERYFDTANWESQTQLSPEDYRRALKECFSKILPRYFAGKQRVALSLTGGLDSRMILAGSSVPKGQLQCYTFGGMYRDSEDVQVARLVAGLCQQPYSVITVDQRFFPHFADLAQKSVIISDGTMDVSGSVGLYVNRLARDLAPVRLTGNYGSEILRENIPFHAFRISTAAFSREFVPFISKACDTYASERNHCRRLSFIAAKQMPWHHYGRLAQEQSQLTVRAPYLDNELVPLAYRMPPGQLLNKQIAYRYTTDTQPLLAGAPTDRGQIRLPRFVPTKLIELSMELRPHAEHLFDYGMPQWLAKVEHVLSPLHLERLFLGHQKYYHFRIWYHHELSKFVQDFLLDPRTLSRPYLNRSSIEKIVRAHVTGSGNHTTEIHKLLTIEIIQRSLIEGR
jgi:asparagine synthase (glutamine-hydrolysing)